MRRFWKGCAIFAVSACVCMALLLAVCAWIPQTSIAAHVEEAVEYFYNTPGFPMVVEGWAPTRVDNFGDALLFDVMYHVDAQHPLRTAIAAPYYRNEGEDIRENLYDSVTQGLPANNDHSRYWNGEQVLVRPLVMFTSVQGCRIILFGLLMAMNAVLAWLLLRLKAVRPLLIYLAGLVLVQFWMCLFTLEYGMCFLVMTGACIAVTASWRLDRTVDQLAERMTVICIVSGVAVCFLDLLTSETLSLTVPVLLWLMLYAETGRKPMQMKQMLRLLARFCLAWLCAYALMFALKWLLASLVLGSESLMSTLSFAAYRIDRSAVQNPEAGSPSARNVFMPEMLARNIGILFPGATRLTVPSVFALAAGVLAVLAVTWHLFRAKKVDGVWLVGLLLMGLVPYARMIVLCSHSLDHYFTTYRAQMATLMALAAVMAYSLKPSDVLGKPSKKKR